MYKRSPPLFLWRFLLFGSQELRIDHLGNLNQVYSHFNISKVSLINFQTDSNIFLVEFIFRCPRNTFLGFFFLFMCRKFLKASALESFFRCIAGIQNSITCVDKNLWYLRQLSNLLNANRKFLTSLIVPSQFILSLTLLLQSY